MPDISKADVIIIGAGPAGITASMYTSRAGLKTIVLYKDFGALEKAAHVDNFYGHLNISGKQLVKNGIRQARDFGTFVVNSEVLDIRQNEDCSWTVKTIGATHTARAILISTGANRSTPRIKGLAALQGRGISYCAICDGFFHRDKDVAVIGNGAYALHEAMDLLPIAKSVTVLTNGKEKLLAKFPENITVRTEKILEICGQSGIMGKTLSGVILGGGECLSLSGLFIAQGVAGGTELAKKLGAIIENNAIFVDSNMRTTVPNIWAAGDCTGGLKQIAKAVYDGAQAGTDIVKSLKES